MLKSSIPPEIRGRIKKLIVYGSRVRGEHTDESDLDLVALVDEKTSEIEKLLDDVAYAVMWEHDFNPIISLKVFSEAKFSQAIENGYSYYRNINIEGVPL